MTKKQKQEKNEQIKENGFNLLAYLGIYASFSAIFLIFILLINFNVIIFSSLYLVHKIIEIIAWIFFIWGQVSAILVVIEFWPKPEKNEELEKQQLEKG